MAGKFGFIPVVLIVSVGLIWLRWVAVVLQTLFLCFSSLLFSVFVDAAAGRAWL